MDDVLFLSRIQFALTIMFHYLFPPLTIGLGVILVYLDGMWWRTGEEVYEQAARFWTRVFALNFAIGVASGIVMEFEFGTNWATYSRFVGDVFGSALAAEGIFAFFLESGFLAVLVFGWNRVSRGFHFFATCMVALGSFFSSIWIVIANSWQQTPAGHHIVPMLRDGEPWIVEGEVMRRAEITNFWEMVFNPSSIERLVHVWLGCLILGSFFVLSVSAYYLLKKRHTEFAQRSFKGALILATLSSLAVLVSGHSQANNVYRTQPAKLAAFEGHYRTGPGNAALFGIPDDEREELRYAVEVPGLLSFLLFGDPEQEVVGLDRFRPEDRPATAIPFASYHLMVGCGTFLIGLSLLGCFLLWRGTLYERRWVLWLFVVGVIPALIANHSGWVAAETGRQPWIVHPPIPRDAGGELLLGPEGKVRYAEEEALRTSEGVSKAIAADQVLGSLILFGLVYLLLFAVWIYVLNEKIQHGPEPLESEREGGTSVGGAEEGFLAAAGDRASPGGGALAGARDVDSDADPEEPAGEEPAGEVPAGEEPAGEGPASESEERTGGQG